MNSSTALEKSFLVVDQSRNQLVRIPINSLQLDRQAFGLTENEISRVRNNSRVAHGFLMSELRHAHR